MVGYSLNVMGAGAFNWKVQHNVLHHTYTNIHDVDEDISPRGILRMTPHSEWKAIHKFQHIYAWFIYGLMTLVWVVVKDFVRLSRYHKDGLVKKTKSRYPKRVGHLDCHKAYLHHIYPCYPNDGTLHYMVAVANRICSDALRSRFYPGNNFPTGSRYRWYRISDAG